WFLNRLRSSDAAWKLWGNSIGMLDWRMDFQNLPEDITPRWPTEGYAQLGDDDWSGYRAERAEFLDFIQRERITCVATLCGDRHTFMAGGGATSLPPQRFEPVIAGFLTAAASPSRLFGAAG